MPVRVIFRCDVCGAQPDEETRQSLQRQVLDLCHGEYVTPRRATGSPGTAAASTAATAMPAATTAAS
jgi:hypothetical protein